ncbi:hypothetical protein ACHHV8_18545 [Paenibacillus sp. TAB 01]|uniref:hypothetical protein n=1 Tax=Paenibacillus sp. TAB 01 TaxID=3368988 RepID=UPI003753D9AA
MWCATRIRNRTVTIKTTRKGEVYPSIYANLIGNEASVEFLQDDDEKRQPETMTVGPYETLYYKKMPDFFPGQGMNVLYDVETDGEVYFSFVAMDAGAGLDTIGMYDRLPYKGNVRGTFDSSDVVWNIDAHDCSKPTSITIGDGTTDKFVTGTDFFSKEDSLNLGNYGVVYKIHLDHPRKMAVLSAAARRRVPRTVRGGWPNRPSTAVRRHDGLSRLHDSGADGRYRAFDGY